MPGLLEGLKNVSRLVAPWIEPLDADEARPARGSRASAEFCGSLSFSRGIRASPRRSSRRRSPRSSAAASRSRSSRCASRPTARRHPVHDEIRARCFTCPSICCSSRCASCAPGGPRDKAFVSEVRVPLVAETSRAIRRPTASAASARRWCSPPSCRRTSTRLHAHFLHTPASVARYAAALLGLPWSGSAHAKDIWTTPEWEKREKLASLRMARDLHRGEPRSSRRARAAGTRRARLSRHRSRAVSALGTLPPRRATAAIGRSGGDPVGRAPGGEEGHRGAARGAGAHPADLHWRFVHVGGGPLGKRLRALLLPWASPSACNGAARSRRTRCWTNTATPTCSRSRAASRATATATACRTCCRGAKPGARLRRDARLGDPGARARRPDRPPRAENDPDALARALEALIANPARRRALGHAGQARVAQGFALDANVEPLARKFGLARPGENRVLRTA